jgi:hypothetical protein
MSATSTPTNISSSSSRPAQRGIFFCLLTLLGLVSVCKKAIFRPFGGLRSSPANASTTDAQMLGQKHAVFPDFSQITEIQPENRHWHELRQNPAPTPPDTHAPQIRRSRGSAIERREGHRLRNERCQSGNRLNELSRRLIAAPNVTDGPSVTGFA